MSLKIQAPAKFNRFLAVLGRRVDGFHDLELVTTILSGVADLEDTLEAEPAESLTLTIGGPFGEGLATDESNLVLRAWRLLERETKRPLPAKLKLTKRIPHGAGLGGGSSDAAAALKLGRDLFQLQLDDSRLLQLAVQLGSDVPLFILGGTVLGLGRGERVFPLLPIPHEPMLIVHGGLFVGTPSVYRGLAEVGYPFPEPCPGLSRSAPPPWRNDLTGAAIWVCPPLAEVRAALAETGGDPLLCGSGSAWAARYGSLRERDAGAAALKSAQPHWSVWSI